MIEKDLNSAENKYRSELENIIKSKQIAHDNDQESIIVQSKNELAQLIKDKRSEIELINEEKYSSMYFEYMIDLYKTILSHESNSNQDKTQDPLMAEKHMELVNINNEIGLIEQTNMKLQERIRELESLTQQHDIRKFAGELAQQLNELKSEHERVLTIHTQLESEIKQYHTHLEGSNGLKEILLRVDGTLNSHNKNYDYLKDSLLRSGFSAQVIESGDLKTIVQRMGYGRPDYSFDSGYGGAQIEIGLYQTGDGLDNTL
ncbi:unnamed protein product [Didymodactylos carnosus]|nr:unnamed protein product [Didymodactylos carnosus]CAF3826299.1 unnamed protein product [Didymodactylos carnosus]